MRCKYALIWSDHVMNGSPIKSSVSAIAYTNRSATKAAVSHQRPRGHTHMPHVTRRLAIVKADLQG